MNRIRAAKGGQLGPEMAVLDVAMATQVLVLSAVDKGLGTCVIKSFQPEIINRILSLPDHVSVEILITVGIPQELPRRMPKRHSSEFIHYNLWARHEF